jgi:hypothetical protein
MMENKKLDEIFSELEKKYTGSKNVTEETSVSQKNMPDNKSIMQNFVLPNINKSNVGRLMSSQNSINEKSLELFNNKNIVLKINKEILDIKDINFEIEKKLFQHDQLQIQFTIASEEIDKYYGYVFSLNNILEMELVNKEGKFKKVFHTFNIENIDIEESMGERAVVNIKTLSATFQLSRFLKLRAFQSLGITYRQIAETIMAEYPDITLHIGNEFDRNIEKIYIQYYESDWDLLVRVCKDINVPMASHLDEIIMGNELNLEVYNAELDNAVYGRGREGENIIFKVKEATDLYNTGERVKITLADQGSQGEKGTDTRIVSKAFLRIQSHYIVNDYELIEMTHEFNQENNIHGGYVTEGKIMKVGGVESVATVTIDFSHGLEKLAGNKFQAYIDEYAGTFNFPYCTEYSSSNSGMFCTPEPSDVVMIYIPKNNENFSYVAGAVNNPGSERFSNPNVRNYTLAGDESSGGAPMFDFQLNSRVFNVNTTDFIGLSSKNNMIMNTKNADVIAENYTANTTNLTEISSGSKSTVAGEISQVSSGGTVTTAGGVYNINGGGNVIINK